MGTVQLSEATLNNMADQADHVAAEIEAAGDALSGDDAPSIEGFETLTALEDVRTQWTNVKVITNRDKWIEHGANMSETASNVNSNDASNAWHIANST